MDRKRCLKHSKMRILTVPLAKAQTGKLFSKCRLVNRFPPPHSPDSTTTTSFGLRTPCTNVGPLESQILTYSDLPRIPSALLYENPTNGSSSPEKPEGFSWHGEDETHEFFSGSSKLEVSSSDLRVGTKGGGAG